MDPIPILDLDIDAGTGVLPADRPFTREHARQAGVERRALERLLDRGELVRLLRGVYAVAALVDVPVVRAQAVALAAGRGGADAVVVDRTAAWVHGVDVTAVLPGPVPLDVRRRTAKGTAWAERDLVGAGGLVITSPLRTAVDLARSGPEGLAVAALDRLLHLGAVRHTELLAELPRWSGRSGTARLRELAVVADARAASAGESVLRLGWHRAALPTPTPGLVVRAGDRLVRLALGVPDRQFAAVTSGQLVRDEVTRADLALLTDLGWRVVVLREDRVLREDSRLWSAHLVREFHQQLLAQVG